jgi:nucleotide-binding universal stress UspA family protein
MMVYRNLLLATDFSEAAKEAGAYAGALAHATRATLHLLHVIEEFSYWESYSLKTFPTPEVLSELEKSARLALEDLFEDEEERKALAIETHVRHGKPFVEIIRAARDVEADVIVIGSHGQSGLAETLFGSTAEKVVRKAPCAVLVVRHPEHEFALP